MKRNKWLLSLSIGLLCCGSAYAQTTVKGKITDVYKRQDLYIK